jgi:pimeloyl-ACP methyl ester carboxylesterase
MATSCIIRPSAASAAERNGEKGRTNLAMTGFFTHEGFDIAYLDRPPRDGGDGEPILLIHGFASSMMVNWVTPGWVKTLAEAGYRVIAFDNRGHGETSRSYAPSDYAPGKMAGDAAALLRHLDIPSAHVMGYSMGARIAAFMALAEPSMVATLVFGGLGIGLVDGVGDWDPIAAALLAANPATIDHPRGKSFRAFADQTKSDRQALAACITTSRTLLGEADVARISQPTLVAVGTTDDIAGSAAALAGLMPHGASFDIAGRDHMLAVGDRSFKARVLEFLAQHPL